MQLPENQLQLLIGGVFTGVAGIITATAVLIRALRPSSQATQVAKQLVVWLEGEDVAGLIPRDLFFPGMTVEQLRDSYRVLEDTSLLNKVPSRLRRRVDEILDRKSVV